MSSLGFPSSSFSVFFFNVFLFLSIGVFCLSICLFIGDWCPWRSEEDVGSWELEFQMVVSSYVDAGN